MSLSPSFGITTPRFRILSADLNTVEKTLYLPIPTRQGIKLSWDEKGSQIVELLDGSKRKKVKGYTVKVQLKYSYYNDIPSENTLAIGTADGQIPSAEDLLTILSTYGQARLEFSPSLQDPFFRCLISKAPVLDPTSNIIFKNYEIEIVGRDVFPVCNLGTPTAPGVNTPVQPVPGVPGPQGEPGAKGDPGTILNGNGAPLVGLGADGDVYLNNTTGDLYQKASGAWSIKTSLLGPQGEQGIQGIQGPPITITANAPLVQSGTSTAPVLSLPAASTSANGYLSSTDWNTFNGKFTPGTALSATTGTFSGVVSASSFDAATLNLGTSVATSINIGTGTATQTVNIGTGSGTTTINIGAAGDTVAIAGTLLTVNTTNLAVSDKLITLNKNGTAGSAAATGIEIEENASISGYLRTTGDRTGFEIKAPATAGVVTITPGATNTSVVLSNDSRLTDSRTASDVYAWAKAATKPSYAFNEITSAAISATTGTFSGYLSCVGHTIVGTSWPSITFTATGTADSRLLFRSGDNLLWRYDGTNDGQIWHSGTFNPSGKANTDQIMYIGTTGVAINRASAALTLAGLTLTTPNIGVATGTSFNSITGLASVAPLIDGTAAVGTSTLAARQDHVHPTDTSRAAVGQTMYIGTTAVAINRATAALTLAGITLTTPNIGVATGTSFNSITGLASVAPLIDGTAAVGTSTLAARQDHVHPTDTTRAAVGQTMYIGTTAVAINRASAAMNLTLGGTLDATAGTFSGALQANSANISTNLTAQTLTAMNNGSYGGLYLYNPSGIRYHLYINASNQLQLVQE